jgi:hypothetical protein
MENHGQRHRCRGGRERLRRLDRPRSWLSLQSVRRGFRKCLEQKFFDLLRENAAPQLGIDEYELWADRLWHDVRNRWPAYRTVAHIRVGPGSGRLGRFHTSRVRLHATVGLAVAVNADKITVPVWFWLGIGVTTVVALAVLGSAALVVILRNVGRELTELLELEPEAVAAPKSTRVRTAIRA